MLVAWISLRVAMCCNPTLVVFFALSKRTVGFWCPQGRNMHTHKHKNPGTIHTDEFQGQRRDKAKRKCTITNSFAAIWSKSSLFPRNQFILQTLTTPHRYSRIIQAWRDFSLLQKIFLTTCVGWLDALSTNWYVCFFSRENEIYFPENAEALSDGIYYTLRLFLSCSSGLL